MVDMDGVIAQLRGASDAELLAVVLAVTGDRPGLSPVHTAAAALSAGGGLTPDVPPDPSRPVIPPEVPPPLTMAAGSASSVPSPDYTDAGVPTFDRVRDRIEERFGTAVGSEELEREGGAARDLDERWQAREQAGRDRLEEIRRSMKER